MAESSNTTTRQQGESRERSGQQERQSRELQTRSNRGLERGGFQGLSSGSPLQFMRRVSEEMDRAFDRMFEDIGFGSRSMSRRGFFDAPTLNEEIWTPRIEAIQKDDKFIVRAELPGLKKEDVEVSITEDALTIQGQRRQEHEEQREGFYHSERSYGNFYRRIPLPEGVIADSAEATFRNGVLEIRLQAPPNEVTRGRRVEITDGASEKSPGK